jgi:MOSC domain-containing protein YiiM
MTKNLVHIKAIYISAKAGAPMDGIERVEVHESGIDGDRYANGKGAYSDAKPQKIRHISLIAEAGIEAANAWLSTKHMPTFSAAETRRNIVLTNISADELNDLVGHTFKLGGVTLKGVELCTPCQRPANLLKKLNFIDAFEGRGGLRVAVLSPGSVSVGDSLHLNAQETE